MFIIYHRAQESGGGGEAPLGKRSSDKSPGNSKNLKRFSRTSRSQKWEISSHKNTHDRYIIPPLCFQPRPAVLLFLWTSTTAKNECALHLVHLDWKIFNSCEQCFPPIARNRGNLAWQYFHWIFSPFSIKQLKIIFAGNFRKSGTFLILFGFQWFGHRMSLTLAFSIDSKWLLKQLAMFQF